MEKERDGERDRDRERERERESAWVVICPQQHAALAEHQKIKSYYSLTNIASSGPTI